MTVRVLVVEDEARLAESLRRGLAGEGFDVAVAATGDAALDLAGARIFDLIVLDLMLPGRDGLEVLGTLRQRGAAVPVLILSARDTVQDRVRGLYAGADDYLVKPFAFDELLARLRVLLRRGRPQDVLRLAVADLEVDRVNRRVVRGGIAIDLTVREYELLEYLAQHQGRVVSREMLVRDVWHEVQRATPLDNVIDVHIARLRKKLDHGRAQPLIHTLRGLGFLFGEAPP